MNTPAHLPLQTVQLSSEDKTENSLIEISYRKITGLMMIKGNWKAGEAFSKAEIILDCIEDHFEHNVRLHLYFCLASVDVCGLPPLRKVIDKLNEMHAKGKMVRVFWSCSSNCEHINSVGGSLMKQSDFKFHV